MSAIAHAAERKYEYSVLKSLAGDEVRQFAWIATRYSDSWAGFREPMNTRCFRAKVTSGSSDSSLDCSETAAKSIMP
jgi:hypothetical protein